MKAIAVLKPSDIDKHSPIFEYQTFTPRTAVRAIVFDGDKVALLHVKKHNYYMLPGGGIESNEEIRAALAREIREELGCGIEIIDELGSIQTYFDRWKKKQSDFCYIARKVAELNYVTPTKFEIEEDHEVHWGMNLSEAIKLVGTANPLYRDGKLVRARDLLFLNAVEPNHGYLAYRIGSERASQI